MRSSAPGNRLFAIACGGVLAALTLFFLALVCGLFAPLRSAPLPRGSSSASVFFAIKLTLLTATVSSLLALAVSIPASYALSRFRFPFRNAVDALLYLPIVLSPIALGAMLLIFFNTAPGRFWEERVFRVVFEVPGIVAAQFIIVVGLAVSLVKSTFDGIDPVYENIARTLGATRFQAFTRVLLPIAKRGILAAFLLTWARAVGEFGATVTLAGATTMKTETLPVAIFLSFASADVHRACVLILISLSLSLGVLFLVRRIYARGR